MQIQCPQCETTFQLDENQLGESGSKVRCSRCGQVFWAEAPAKTEAPFPVEAIPEDFDLTPEEATSEEPELPPEEELMTAFQGAPQRRVGAMVGFFLLLLLLVITVRYSYLQLLEPDQEFGETLKKVFFLDSDPRGAKRIRLQEVKGYFKTNPLEGRFFVVEGKVVNGYSNPRDSIHLRGNLKNAAQQVVATREVVAGWRLNPEELETLSFAEINTLAAGQPQRFSSKIHLAPTAAAPFMIIFPPSPQPLAEFSVEVVDSKKSSAAARFTHK